MDLQLIPHKTDTARQLLSRAGPSTEKLAPGLRMLLITIDGRKTLAELMIVARGIGLPDTTFRRLHAERLISWQGTEVKTAAETVARTVARTEGETERAKRLVRAKFFALDLAARMLAGRDQALREQARAVDSESSFQRWIEDCSATIASAADEERAALFRERVSQC